MAGDDLFDEDDPLEGLDTKYLQDPLPSDFGPRKLIGNRIYSADQIKCSAGCGRRVSIYYGKKGSGQKRKTCGDPECLHKILVQNGGKRKQGRRGAQRRANYGTTLPRETPFRETAQSLEEVTRIIDEADRKTWRL
jgi:hypothetical protein